MSSRTPGRHRAPGRPNPVAELSVVVTRNARPAAVIAVSGGVVASTLAAPSFAAPAAQSAAPAKAAAVTARVVAKTAAAPVQATSSVASLATVRTVAAKAVTTKNVSANAVKRDTKAAVSAPAVSRQVVRRSVERAALKASVTRNVAATTTSKKRTSSTRSAVTGGRVNRTMPERTRQRARTAKTFRTSAKKTAKAGRLGGGVLSVASRLTGIMYRWGGTTPSGFDCSGFTSYVFRKVGVSLPRTARAQQRFAKRVSNPRPGDLVFFGYPAHHVGIYAGAGMMYDSPRRGKRTTLRKIYTNRVSYGRVL